MAAEPERFAALLNTPTVEDMYNLTPKEFERFVAYVHCCRIEPVPNHLTLEMLLTGEDAIA